jgi:hypothetical protein
MSYLIQSVCYIVLTFRFGCSFEPRWFAINYHCSSVLNAVVAVLKFRCFTDRQCYPILLQPKAPCAPYHQISRRVYTATSRHSSASALHSEADTRAAFPFVTVGCCMKVFFSLA